MGLGVEHDYHQRGGEALRVETEIARDYTHEECGRTVRPDSGKD